MPTDVKKIDYEVDSCLLIICVYAIYTHNTQDICQSFLDIYNVCINEKAKYVDTIVNLVSMCYCKHFPTNPLSFVVESQVP